VVRQARSVRAAIGYVPQMLSADRSLMARENLLRSARLNLIRCARRHGRVKAALELLVMDEPTVGLDPVARHAMWERIRRIRAGGTTILITSNLMEAIEALCDRVGILHQGRLVAAVTPGELETRVGPGAGMDEVFLIVRLVPTIAKA
jgi:ABC-2 type transport system ATP-binding protein